MTRAIGAPLDQQTGDLARLIGRRVIQLREERNTSLSALARDARLSKATLSELEKGDGNPTLATLEALAVALDVTVVELLAPPGEMKVSVASSPRETVVDPPLPMAT